MFIGGIVVLVAATSQTRRTSTYSRLGPKILSILIHTPLGPDISWVHIQRAEYFIMQEEINDALYLNHDRNSSRVCNNLL